MNIESKRIIKVLIIFTALFISLVIYLSYFEVFQAAEMQKNAYNKRQWVNEENILRGMIVDRNGKPLASSEKTENGQIRHYPFGSLYSHIIGYSLKEYGKAGLEASYNQELLNIDPHNPIKEFKEKISGTSKDGNNLVLTIDHSLQAYAEQKLRGKKGAIVLLNPQTGEVYAMVSKPDFNPSKLKENWMEITENLDSPLLNRGIMGLYTPGSVFKVITATAALEEDVAFKKFRCEGSMTINGYVLRDYKGTAHGEIDLEKALVKSCNLAFSQMGLQLGRTKLNNVSERYMFNKTIPFDLTTKNSVFPENKISTRPDLAVSAIGQGKILVTPLNMAMVAAAIANDGLIMRPFLVKEVLTPQGRTVKGSNTQVLSKATSETVAHQLQDMMVKVVKEGTGRNARIRNVEVAGKTGTAENETKKTHAWFIGFAPVENPKVAIAVVLESAGKTGGESAAPIARDIMIKALGKLQ
jgi:peptidoglycan glycosyltransferase